MSQRAAPDTAYINGEQLPLGEATVSVLDRGFLFADAVYEVIPVYDGQLFLLPQHLQRLQNSLDGIRLANPHSDEQWTAILQSLVDTNGGGNLALYLQITRGAPAKREHRFPADTRPNVVAFCQPRTNASDDVLTRGVAVITGEDQRWNRCNIKSTSLLPNVMASDEAIAAGGNEMLLYRGDEVLEGASSNFFAVINGRLVTPALDNRILPGITRAWIIDLASRNNMPVSMEPVSRGALMQASEVWLTSSTREVFPVTSIDGQPVGEGMAGPLWQTMRQWVLAEVKPA